MTELEISALQTAEKIKNNENFVILDVREHVEIARVALNDERVVVLPMSQIGAQLENAFSEALKNRELEIVVMCHHGVRSLQVTQWMRQQGWQNVRSMAGGIDAYARTVDRSIGFY